MMRSVVILLVVLLAGCASTQTRLPGYLATKTPYQTPTRALVPPPAGCRPIHIEGVFRHGSRYLNDSEDNDKLIALLEDEKAKSSLTPQRQAALDWAYADRKTFQRGMLTKQGERELYEMGRRLGKTYRDLFLNKVGVVQMVSAPKKRTQESLALFKAGLASVVPVRVAIEPTDSNLLRFFAHCKNYQGYKNALMKTLSTNAEAKHLYALCQQDYNVDREHAEERFCSLLTPELKRKLYEKARAKSYYKFGPPADSGMACLLLEPMFGRMQSVVAGKATPVAHLAFGHAETVVPLGNFFELFNLALEEWNPSQVAPMGVNLQMITYECASGEAKSYKVKLLYNEKEYVFRTPECQASPYCDWLAVKAYYEKRKQDLGLKSCSESDWNQHCGNKSATVND